MAPQNPDNPSAMNAQADLAGQVASIDYWYHKIDLPGGITTPGWAPINPAVYRIPDDMTGLRVLDVGAWDGYWTFEALKRGAREVVAIDDFSDFLGKLEERQRPGWASFDICRDAFGFDETLALDRLAAICDQAMFVESAILDDYSPYRGGIGKGYPDGQMVMEFYPDSQYGNNKTNYWVPTLHCLGHMVRSTGFANVDGGKLVERPEALPYCRGVIAGYREGAAMLKREERA